MFRQDRHVVLLLIQFKQGDVQARHSDIVVLVILLVLVLAVYVVSGHESIH